MSVSRYCQLVIIFRLVSGAPSTKIAYRLVPGLQLQAKLVQGQRTPEVHCKLAEIRDGDVKGALNLQRFFNLMALFFLWFFCQLHCPGAFECH